MDMLRNVDEGDNNAGLPKQGHDAKITKIKLDMITKMIMPQFADNIYERLYVF